MVKLRHPNRSTRFGRQALQRLSLPCSFVKKVRSEETSIRILHSAPSGKGCPIVSGCGGGHGRKQSSAQATPGRFKALGMSGGAGAAAAAIMVMNGFFFGVPLHCEPLRYDPLLRTILRYHIVYHALLSAYLT